MDESCVMIVSALYYLVVYRGIIKRRSSLQYTDDVKVHHLNLIQGQSVSIFCRQITSSKILSSHIFRVLLHTAESMVKELLVNLSVPKMGEELKESNDPLGEYLPVVAFVITCFCCCLYLHY